MATILVTDDDRGLGALVEQTLKGDGGEYALHRATVRSGWGSTETVALRRLAERSEGGAANRLSLGMGTRSRSAAAVLGHALRTRNVLVVQASTALISWLKLPGRRSED